MKPTGKVYIFIDEWKQFVSSLILRISLNRANYLLAVQTLVEQQTITKFRNKRNDIKEFEKIVLDIVLEKDKTIGSCELK